MKSKDSWVVDHVRKMAARGKILFRQHALDRMGERKIWRDDVLKAIERGENIHIQKPPTETGKNIRVFFQEATDENIPSFCVIVAIEHPYAQIITVYYFKEEKGWSYDENLKIWRHF